MATKWYVEQILEAGCAFINCIPVFIASQPYWHKRFQERGLPIIGDDIKSQVGATITHRVLANLFRERGVHLDRTYQLNFGGNTDFMNMLERERLESKKISKTRAVTSQLDHHLSDAQAHVGPSDYVPWLEDRKWCYIRMEGTTFGNVPLNCEVKLEVWDSPNSAGVVIDAIRCAKLALDRGIGGPLIGPASYFMKSPPQQFTDNKARELVEAFIKGEAENTKPETKNSKPDFHDRSNQALERTEQSFPLGFHDGSEVGRVFGNDEARGNGHSQDRAQPAADPGRHFAD
jgi:myo-inositol-1-phosphate synthase